MPTRPGSSSTYTRFAKTFAKKRRHVDTPLCHCLPNVSLKNRLRKVPWSTWIDYGWPSKDVFVATNSCWRGAWHEASYSVKNKDIYITCVPRGKHCCPSARSAILWKNCGYDLCNRTFSAEWGRKTSPENRILVGSMEGPSILTTPQLLTLCLI